MDTPWDRAYLHRVEPPPDLTACDEQHEEPCPLLCSPGHSTHLSDVHGMKLTCAYPGKWVVCGRPTYDASVRHQELAPIYSHSSQCSVHRCDSEWGTPAQFRAFNIRDQSLLYCAGHQTAPSPCMWSRRSYLGAHGATPGCDMISDHESGGCPLQCDDGYAGAPTLLCTRRGAAFVWEVRGVCRGA